VFSASVRELWRFRYVRPDAATRLDSRGWTFRRRLLEGLEHAVEVAAHGGHVRVVGAKGAPPLASVRSSCSPAPSRHGWRSGRTLPSRGPDIDLDTCPDSRPRWTPWLGLLDGASGHPGGRPPRPTACRTRSAGRLQSSIRASWPGSTNDERLQSALGGGPAGCPSGVQPSRSGASIPTAVVRVLVKRLARPSPSRPGSVQPGRKTLFAQLLRSLNSGPDQGKRSPLPAVGPRCCG
jgi:hypothetical protein